MQSLVSTLHNIDMIDTDKQGSEDSNNDIQEMMDGHNDSDFGDGTTSIMSNLSILNDISETSEKSASRS